jgi:hypothetical protein
MLHASVHALDFGRVIRLIVDASIQPPALHVDLIALQKMPKTPNA